MKFSNNNEVFFTWAYTPYRVALYEKQESLLELPVHLFNPTAESAFAHFSVIRNGIPFNWLWLFADRDEAIRLRLLPGFAADGTIPGSTELDLVGATIPSKGAVQGAPKEIELLAIAKQDLWNLLDRYDPEFETSILSEIWVGFNFPTFRKTSSLRGSANIYSVAEFKKQIKQA